MGAGAGIVTAGEVLEGEETDVVVVATEGVCGCLRVPKSAAVAAAPAAAPPAATIAKVTLDMVSRCRRRDEQGRGGISP